MSKDILVYTKHEEIFEKVKDCVEKVKREKALVGQNFYVKDGKGLLFDVEINWIWNTGNLTLKVVCDTFEGYGDKEPCCVILKDLTDKQIANIFTDLIFKRMASIRKDIEKDRKETEEKDRKETEKKEAENDIHELKVEINRVITDLIRDVGGDTGLFPPHEYCDMSAFTSCRPCVASRSFKWGAHKFSISINTKDHSMNCLLINWLGHNKLIFEFKDPFTPYSNLSNICSIADAIIKTIKEEEKKAEEKVKNLQACNNRQYNTITNLQKNIDLKTEELRLARQCYNDLKKSEQLLKDICSEKDKTIEELKKQIEALNLVIERRSDQLNDCQKQLELRTEELCERENRIKELKECNNRQYEMLIHGDSKVVDELRDQIKHLIDIKKNQEAAIEDLKRKVNIYDERATKYMQKYGDEVKDRERNNMANAELYNEVMSKYKAIHKRVKRYGGYLADIERAYWDMDKDVNNNNGLAGIMIFKSKMENILRNWKDLSQDEE